ncbi:sensor histidine kinase [Cohnella hongkongensis]|uniref:Sensor histidine kinase n=1 Tax=Cohnella hongkongensis TaxID=178337 RepID=A0ABV9FHZ4_9BACL
MKRKLILIFTPFVTLVILTIGLLTYNISIQRLEENKEHLIWQNLAQTNKLIDFNLEVFLRKCEMIFSSTTIQEAIGKDYGQADGKEIYNAYLNAIYKTIEPVIQDLVYPNLTLKPSPRGTGTDMIKVVIYSNNPSFPKDGQLVKDYGQIDGEGWVEEMLSNSTRPYYRSLFNEDGTDYISINRVLTDFRNLRQLGVLSIKIPVVRLAYLMEQDNANANLSLILLDGQGSVVSEKADAAYAFGDRDLRTMLELTGGNGGAKVFDYETDGKKYIYAYAPSELSGWNMLAVYPMDEIYRELSPIKSAVAITLIVGIAVSILLTFAISVLTTRRLEKIKRKMDFVKRDRNIVLSELQGNDEIGRLDRSFNEMIRKINRLVEQEKELQDQKSSLQVELLQSQINPHLLYNTLAAIKWRSKKEGVADVSLVADKLIRFFKYFLNKGAVMSSLANELDMIAQYLDILRFTYEMELDVTMRVDEAVYSYHSLNLILQPVVENAVIHGIRPLERRGRLEIEGGVRDGSLYFVVKDNGVGMDAETVDKLNSGAYEHASGGYGIRNVKRRIKLIFGEPYDIRLRSAPNEGTEATLVLPALLPDRQL